MLLIPVFSAQKRAISQRGFESKRNNDEVGLVLPLAVYGFLLKYGYFSQKHALSTKTICYFI